MYQVTIRVKVSVAPYFGLFWPWDWCYALADIHFATACWHKRRQAPLITGKVPPTSTRDWTSDQSTRTASRSAVARHGVGLPSCPSSIHPPPGPQALHRHYSYTLLITRLCIILVIILWFRMFHVCPGYLKNASQIKRDNSHFFL